MDIDEVDTLGFDFGTPSSLPRTDTYCGESHGVLPVIEMVGR